MSAGETPRNYRYLTGHVVFGKTLSAAFEALPETDFLVLVRADPDFIVIESQPVCINYTDADGRETRFWPDFLVTYRAGAERRPQLVEIRTVAELREKKHVLRDRFIAAHHYAKARGWQFKVRTDQKIRGPRLENLKRLKSHERHAPSEVRLRRLIKIVREANAITFNKVIATVAKTQQERAEWLPTLWYAIARNLICTDLEVLISGQSPLWVPRG